MSGFRWFAGAPEVRRAVESWWRGEVPRAMPLRENQRRRLIRLPFAEAEALLIKQFRTASGEHRIREQLKAICRVSGADREWRALRILFRAAVPVPEPLALGDLPNGDRVLVQRFVAGEELIPALTRLKTDERRHALRKVGLAVEHMHRCGFVHGDLHAGNFLVSPAGPVLLDLQRTRRTRCVRRRTRDLGWLDYSLTPYLPLSNRLRLRIAALGVHGPFSEATRRRLRDIGLASLRRAAAHARSRTRRSLRPGRRFATARVERFSGLRLREVAADVVADAFQQHREALARNDERVLKRDGRSQITALRIGNRRVVVKEVLPRRFARCAADALRGSPARRAWRGGHGLLARGIGAATPLAFLERRWCGLPRHSLVLLEDLRPALPVDRLAEQREDAPALLDALVKSILTLHRRGADHGDLKASHFFLVLSGGRFRAHLIDLEGVRFRRRLSDHRRVRALAELNASLPDACPAAPRRQAFLRYARALPFRHPTADVLREIVKQSLARGHRWRGVDCEAMRK